MICISSKRALAILTDPTNWEDPNGGPVQYGNGDGTHAKKVGLFKGLNNGERLKLFVFN